MASANTKPKNSPVETSRYPCLCAVTRKAGRILTKQYDKYLKPSGLKTTQFSMLVNIARNPAITVSELAELLAMDQTTVSRNLRLLEKIGYIHLEPGVADQRIKRIQIADMGMSKMNEARPLWQKAQLDMERVLGRASIEGLLSSFKKMAR
jgi:MarR family transcriptional regulator, organic hydroperoxide resistance regulator